MVGRRWKGRRGFFKWILIYSGWVEEGGVL